MFRILYFSIWVSVNVASQDETLDRETPARTNDEGQKCGLAGRRITGEVQSKKQVSQVPRASLLRVLY